MSYGRELRTYNHISSYWKPLPLMNGDPLPAGINFPTDVWELKRMSGTAMSGIYRLKGEGLTFCFAEVALRRLAALYGVGDEESSLENTRDNLSLFLAGKRAP